MATSNFRGHEEIGTPWWKTGTIVLSHILAFTFIYRGYQQVSFFTFLLFIVIGHYVMDFIAENVHLVLDNYFDESTPLIGFTVHYFREHHVKPKEMFKRNFVQGNFKTSFLFMLFGLPIKYIFNFGPRLDISFGVVLFASNYIHLIHKWTHLPDNEIPMIGRILQKLGVIVDREFHREHHKDYTQNYALYSGCASRFLKLIAYHHLLEAGIYLFFGVPACNTQLGIEKKEYESKNLAFAERWKLVKWKCWYTFVCWLTESNEMKFQCMNWGYFDENDDPSKYEDTEEKYCLRLYDEVVNGTDLKGKVIADVSCGRGGGIAYLTKKYEPAKATGGDFTPYNVELCKNSFSNIPRLEFRVEDACNMRHETESLDVLISVEASHCYPSYKTFLSEAKRVLKPGGRLVWTDFISTEDFEALRENIKESGFKILRDRDVTPNILAAMEKDMERKAKFVGRHIPGFFRSWMIYFAGADKNAATYTQFSERRSVYFMVTLEK